MLVIIYLWSACGLSKAEDCGVGGVLELFGFFFDLFDCLDILRVFFAAASHTIEGKLKRMRLMQHLHTLLPASRLMIIYKVDTSFNYNVLHQSFFELMAMLDLIKYSLGTCVDHTLKFHLLLISSKRFLIQHIHHPRNYNIQYNQARTTYNIHALQ